MNGYERPYFFIKRWGFLIFNRKDNENVRIRRYRVTIFASILCLCVIALGATLSRAKDRDPLPSWREGKTKSSITAFVIDVTTEASSQFVLEEERVAVFDNNGTLWSEQPMYFFLYFAIDRVITLAPQHPEWKEKQPFRAILEGDIKTRFELRSGSPVLVRLPEFDFFNNREIRPVSIQKFIGRRPIVAFGNSDGDLQMLQWTAEGDGARFMSLVHHTDNVREWAYDRDSRVGHLDKGLDEAENHRWTVVDMKVDWGRIYPFQEVEGTEQDE